LYKTYSFNIIPIDVTIHEEFSNPVNLETAGSVDRILLGLINQPSQKRDEFISEELTNHLFQTPGFPFGMDLASLNIQRARDHGIPPFVEWRLPCMLSPVKNWKDLERIMAPETVRKFKDLYAAVEDIDLFSAGLAERPVVGGLVGATFACIIAQQFRSLRKGDRFWYENPFIESGFTPLQLQQIRKVTLAQILCHTLDNVDNIQPFVMLAVDNMKNQRFSCNDPILDQINLEAWIENVLQTRESSLTNDGVYLDEEEIEEKSNNQDTESRVAPLKIFNQRVPQRQNPVKSTINQQNHIVVKRPVGPGENITIIVNNHAVHSPIIIRDSVYGSNLNINQPSNSDSRLKQPNIQSNYQKPTALNGHFIQVKSTAQKSTPSQRPHNSFSTMNPYYPQNFQDQNNPNPPNYNLNAKPLNNFFPNNEFFSYNLPNLINTIHPHLQNDNSIKSQEGFYSVTKKTKPMHRPSSSLLSELNEFNQEESYVSTKKPNLSYRPNIKLVSTTYDQEIKSNVPPKLQGSYNPINNK
jgi:peroxidase